MLPMLRFFFKAINTKAETLPAWLFSLIVLYFFSLCKIIMWSVAQTDRMYLDTW